MTPRVRSEPSTRMHARIWSAAAGVWAAIVGAAPHVLHHVGPLAGAAIVSGATGRVIFAIAGFVLTIPLLRRMRRRSGNWRLPLAALAIFATIYVLSSFVVGPRLTGSSNKPSNHSPTSQSLAEHEAHTGGGHSG